MTAIQFFLTTYYGNSQMISLLLLCHFFLIQDMAI